MKICKFFLIILITFYLTPGLAKTKVSAFVTSLDLLNSHQIMSNLSLQNNRTSTTTVYGLYVRQYAYVLPGQSCDAATPFYPASDNIIVGAYVTPIAISPGKQAVVGSNYLYNMIYQAIYYVDISSVSPIKCSLPGCTWGSDSSLYNWCIYLGALAPVSTSADYTASVPPVTELASSSGLYNYNLISNYSYLGPITCNDETLTCVNASQQSQAFS
jgi:hypothetical protein